jgi:hypothetical protein
MLLSLSISGLTVLVAVVVGLSWYGRRSESWGASAEEVAMAMTGDEWLANGPRARVRMTRAVWVDTTPSQLWPWIAQLGRGAGWYSYDRLDNGGRMSARHIVGWIPAPRLGDAAAIGYLRRVEPGRELAWWLPGIDFLGARFRGVTVYRLSAEGDSCRLVARMQAEADGLLGGVACWLFRVVDGFMARRQLVEIKGRAERWAGRATDPEHPETGEPDQYQLYQVIFASGDGAGVRGKESAARWRRAAIEDGVIQPDPEPGPGNAADSERRDVS